MKAFIKNRQRLIKISHRQIESDSKKILRLLDLEDSELSILFVNDRVMRSLNHKYRGKNKTTDVLSFPQRERSVFSRLGRLAEESVRRSAKKYKLRATSLLLGDIVINLHAAKRQAPEHELTFKKEIRWLLIHGMLHLIGYDHERSKNDETKMKRKERELLLRMERHR